MKKLLATKVIDNKIIRFKKEVSDRECKICGKIFTPHMVNSKYCSKKCGAKVYSKKYADAHKEDYKKWYKKNRELILKKNREKYHSDIEAARKTNREWNNKNRDKRRQMDRKSHDKHFHGRKKAAAIEKYGLICNRCGTIKTNYAEIAMHHTTFNAVDHDNQELLCRECHASIHNTGRKPHNFIPITKEQLLKAIDSTKTLVLAGEKLGISQTALLNKRKLFNLPIRKRNEK